jgi:hypothetical protein
MADDVGDQERATQVAVLYELWTLDVIPDLGVAAGVVFARHPQQFKNVVQATADSLALLRYRTGYDDQHLDANQRSELCTPLLGASDGTRHAEAAAAFHQAAAGLRQAAVDFVQRSFDSGEEQLRNAFRDAAKSFHGYLSGVEGAVAESAVRRLVTHFDQIVTVLRDQRFSGGLGLPPAPSAPWPRFGDLDGDGAALVEALDREASEAGLTTRTPLDQAEFMAIQRIADQGAASIDAILADPTLDSDAAADAAINGAYRWWTAIRDYRGGE